VDLVRQIGTRLARDGLNLVGATSVAAYDARVPPAFALAPHAGRARGVIVVGNGGGAFWSAYRAFCRDVPAHETMPDPLDRYTRDTVTRATADLAGARCVFPFDFPAIPVSFQALAEAAGLGRPSLVGVLVHPVYGPWIALRAAVLVPVDVTALRPADDFDPCPTCIERSCIAACPVGAVTPAGWDVGRCAAERLRAEERCGGGCHARIDCVLGRAHRYPSDAQAFHQAAACRAMARHPSAASKA
jgi:hypothetical protein